MPSHTKKQHNAMCAAAHGASGKIPQSIGREFCNADKGGKFDKSKKRGRRLAPPHEVGAK